LVRTLPRRWLESYTVTAARLFSVIINVNRPTRACSSPTRSPIRRTTHRARFRGNTGRTRYLLAEGLASKQLTEDEFWSSVSKRTDALLAEHKTGLRS